jgi:uncharacterized protein with HEPN domain
VKEDSVYLHHILHCIQRVEADTSNGYQFFLASPTHQDAAMRNLQLMAESTQRLSHALKSAHSEVPWKAIAAFRNVLVHDYLGVDVEIVWDVIVRDLPLLKQAIVRMLAEHY